MTHARAHPNIALVKYWGKQDKPGNLPATPNLSITLDNLATDTVVSTHHQDEVWLNQKQVADQKIFRFLEELRSEFELAPIRIETSNNFPTGAGLASSASGFAALICAINQHADLGLNADLMSDWARRGSASAARSLFGGYVALVPPLWRAQPIAPASHWPLKTVVAITNETQKSISSSEGMERSRLTSDFYTPWLRGAGDDFAAAFDAINNKDFAALAEIAELSCLKMHSVMLTSLPTLSYWNPATLACMDAVRELRNQGTPVFFTVDAGPQVKAVCEPQHETRVSEVLTQVPGVIRTITCGLGNAAHIVEP
ncbi:MAG: diphosphomevalonate decarboxylase [Pseudomonadaceae bacterium]|nr:diphosphomevalonate decarboxylase [Pseudomonadaceae bacterium]